ncbi:MAG: DUF881 domain-containing protein [Actinobacteria bacterium]|nr:DUF881 domain-containing protein [Actinomycetota bacterium]MCG2807356.1 DUF881 domain-containing protein [Coriobacteriia bacterium]
MGSPAPRARQTLTHLREESIRAIVASERAVERRFNEARLVASLAVAMLLVGFLLVAQWRGNASFSATLDNQSDQNLAILIEDLTTQNSALRNDVMRLEVRILDAERAGKDRGEVLNDAAKELAGIRAIAGLDPVSGPGVAVALSDPERVLLPQDFVALINELRAGGAEAIGINGVRVVASSGISGTDGVMRVGDTSLSANYELLAIGDAANLEQSLALPGGLKATLSTFPGVTVVIDQREAIALPAAGTS